MELEKELYRYNPWWESDFESLKDLIERDNLPELINQFDNKQIVFITGLRRIGKTCLMKLSLLHLINKRKVLPKHCLYVSMDDYLLLHTSLIDLVESYRTMHRIRSNEKIYLFLDEITFAKDYELQLKNLYDKGYVKIFASSSNASLMREGKAMLTGRSATFEVMPLNFKEYLTFKNIVIKKADEHLNDSYFREFLSTGGIPEYVKTGDNTYIRELTDNIIYKDIAAINGIKNIQQLKDFFLLLMERSGKTFSINKVAKVLKISTDTAKRYFDFFCGVYIVHPVVRFGKLNEQLVSPKKIYACDTGIRTYYTGERDWGSLFENYVYLRIKHLKPSYIYQNGLELDFYTLQKCLLECKFHEEELSEKQQSLFESFKAKKKQIIRNENDIHSFLTGL